MLKFSIISAVYNSESTVADSLRSIASQSYDNIEHIIVDGNSSDSSLNVIKEHAVSGAVIISEPDDGIYDALNKGIRRATGDIVGFVHSDDFLADSEAITRIAKEFENKDVEAVFAKLDYVSRDDVTKTVRHWNTGAFSRSKLEMGWMPAHPTLYLRRSVYEDLGGFDTSFSISADYEFILRYFSQTKLSPVFIPEVIYKMRMGGVSNRNFGQVLNKMNEDLRAIRMNNIGGFDTLFRKNFSKLAQFYHRS